MSSAQPLDDDNAEDTAPPLMFPNVGEWVENWFRHVMADQFDREHRWCTQWWRHDAVVARLDALHQAWEAARLTGDGAAVSAWWVQHADPHWRAITATSGPLHQCTPDEHRATKPIATTPPPPTWFDPA